MFCFVYSLVFSWEQKSAVRNQPLIFLHLWYASLIWKWNFGSGDRFSAYLLREKCSFSGTGYWVAHLAEEPYPSTHKTHERTPDHITARNRSISGFQRTQVDFRFSVNSWFCWYTLKWDPFSRCFTVVLKAEKTDSKLISIEENFYHVGWRGGGC